MGDATILLVEDDEDLRRMVARVLEHDGYTVREARDGVHALEQCDPLPDLILADLMMPRMDGEAFLHELRRRVPDLAVPVVLLTASAIREEVAARLGVQASLEKPFEVLELRDLVRELCQAPAQ